jgi:hypothetical protein
MSKMNRIAFGLLVLILATVAHGQSLYSSGSPNLSTIWYGDASNAPATWAAAEFTLGGGTATINQLSWWGGFTQAGAASANDSFSMSIYSAAGGTVGSLLATVNLGNAGQAATGRLIQNAPEYAYNASFASLVLGSGTYFLALQRSGGPGIWGWETANATGLEAYQNAGGAWGYNPGVNLAFSLGGTLVPVPEVPGAILWMLGLPLIGLLRRRRRPA